MLQFFQLGRVRRQGLTAGHSTWVGAGATPLGEPFGAEGVNGGVVAGIFRGRGAGQILHKQLLNIQAEALRHVGDVNDSPDEVRGTRCQSLLGHGGPQRVKAALTHHFCALLIQVPLWIRYLYNTAKNTVVCKTRFVFPNGLAVLHSFQHNTPPRQPSTST